MQEKVQVKDTSLIIQDEQLLRGTNVRPKGSEIRAGALALETGTFLSPAAIGFLAAMGIQQAKVYPHPSISILITGKEIRKPGEQLRPGEVYDANSFILHAALNRIRMDKIDMVFVDDELELVQHALSDALLRSDLVLLTGGISVGDYDFVLRAANACGVQQYFHSVKQKPGKPLFFGKKADKLVFGLPGNPSSVLTCFYEYVIPALEGMTRRVKILRTAMLPMAKNYSKKAGLTHFLKARAIAGSVSPLDAQESYRLSSFAQADVLIVLEEDRTDWKAGDLVEVHFID
jgi:molybdopterin molybdotransferase